MCKLFVTVWGAPVFGDKIGILAQKQRVPKRLLHKRLYFSRPLRPKDIDMRKLVQRTLEKIRSGDLLSPELQEKGFQLFNEGQCVLLTQSAKSILVFVGNEEDGVERTLVREFDALEEVEYIAPYSKKKPSDWDEFSFAALLAFQENLNWMQPELNGKKYTREGMIRRVLAERKEKAKTANYKVKLADNIYGEHTLYNEKGVEYKITLWDFEKEIGYINNIDWRTNKLGTTKHIMFLFNYFKEHPKIFNRLKKKKAPYVEITLDPLNDYQTTWVYPHKLPRKINTLIKKYFGEEKHIPDNRTGELLSFLNETRKYDEIVVRPEVYEKIEKHFNANLIAGLKSKFKPDYSAIKAELFPYQKEGVEFALFRENAIIADEMGLGKTIQAISTAILKKQLFDFKRTLIICPASIKHQWKSEIEKFCDEKAIVVEGLPDERKKLYFETEPFFFIVNYETVLRDLTAINAADFDFVILDEAQKIKNFETKTANAIRRIRRKHALVITGTPIENKLIDLFSIVQFLDPYFLTPLWEFSYQHCIFDEHSKNRILGYYNLASLKQRMSSILIRREKRLILKQLPNIVEEDVFVQLHPEQSSMHAGFSRGIARILAKKFKTTYDWQKLMLLLSNMRMVCDSTFLIDKKTNYSPKLIELQDILVEKLDVKNSNKKIIVFSEWVNMLNLIGEMLTKNGIGFVKLTGKVPVKKRKKLIEAFESDDDCHVFLSTDAGGSGLNLQMADTVINFELPWNPAKKNQRTGRIDRLGQKKNKLFVLNFISLNSIEEKIATGLLLKQNLFDGVLNEENSIDEVDFSNKGRSQFIRQLEEIIKDDVFAAVPQEIPAPDVEHEDLEMVEEILDRENQRIDSQQSASPAQEEQARKKMEQMEEVLNKGMEFLSGIYQMATGESLQQAGNHKIEIDKETGEVVMRFKIAL